MSRIRTLLHNIKMLSGRRIEEYQWDSLQLNMKALRYGGMMDYSVQCEIGIFDSEKTLDLLLSDPKSFYRFGDGEINIMLGKDAGTQKYDKKLAKLLLTALTDSKIDAYIGIGYDYFHFNIWGGTDFSNRFYLFQGDIYRDFYLKNCNRSIQYIDTGFSQRYFNMDKSEMANWFSKLKSMFKNRNIVLFMGKASYDNLQYYIFEDADTIEYIPCRSKNAFDDFDSILIKAKNFSKDKTLCFAIGAASKAAIYKLTKLGYTAFDLGHMPKDYDSYMKGIEVSSENALNFYKEDYKLK